MSKKAQTAAKYAELSKSKKKKTPNQSYIPTSQFADGEYEPGENGSSKKSLEAVSPAMSRRRKVSQIIDYHYVKSDLKRIAVIGGIMLLALVVLAFVIH